MADSEEKVLCRTPTPGKAPVRIPRWKFELSAAERDALGSISWHTTTVKLHLETTGELRRVDKASPQALVRC